MLIHDGDVFSSSVRGNVRKKNEDSCGVFDVPNGKLYVVCDGMGGHAGGATASKIGVDSIANFFQQTTYSDIKQALADALEYANLQILDAANETPALKGMGTTACVLLIQEDKAWIAHCGDSRIYLYCANQKWLHRITKDHSYVQGLVDQGIITDAEAEHHPNKNRILKALGIKPGCKPTICEQPILPANGDTFLICSDGLSGMVNDEQLQYVLQQDGTILQKGQLMIQLALQAGGLDNITVQLIKISDSPHSNSVFVSQNPKERLSATLIQNSMSRPYKKKVSKHIWMGVSIAVFVFVIAAVGLFLPKSVSEPIEPSRPLPTNPGFSNQESPKNDTSTNDTSHSKGNYSITYQEVYPKGPTNTVDGNYEADIKVNKFCNDSKKNYRYTQVIKGRSLGWKEIQNVKVLYRKIENGKFLSLTITKPNKTEIPSPSSVVVKQYNCDLYGTLTDSIVNEDVQWYYIYYEDNVVKEHSPYYDKTLIQQKAQEKLSQSKKPDKFCKVKWFNLDGCVEEKDNKTEYDSYINQKEKENSNDTSAIKQSLTEVSPQP